MYPYVQIVLPAYTVMAFCGGICALIYVFARLERFKVEFTQFLIIFVLCVVGGVIGSKVVFAATQIGWLLENFSIQNLLLLIPQSGYVFYGGLFGVILTLHICTHKDKELNKRIFRMVAPAMPLFHAFGRIGCFLTGCCYGKELTTPVQIMGVELTRIPVQLIESAAEFVLFVVLVIWDKKKDDSDLLRVYLISYALIRFADEFLRGDVVRGIYFGISTAQWISMAILGYYAVKMIRSGRMKKITV